MEEVPSYSLTFFFKSNHRYVSGLQAANLLLERDNHGDNHGKAHPVLPVREDEEQFKTSVRINNEVMKVVPRFWVR